MQTLKQLLLNLLQIFGYKPPVAEWPDTVGPEPDEYPIVKIGDVMKHMEASFQNKLEDGWWSEARKTPAHVGRVGRGIIPQTLIVHTTDMRPGTFNAIVKSWTTQKGKGNGAHFLFGKTEKDGIVQFVQIHKNGNHAGGTNCGGIKLPSGAIVNPNVCSVGIELDNAGKLAKDKAGWYHPDTKYRFAAEDVFVDEKGRGWEKVTEYQMKMLKLFWTALKPTLKPWLKGTVVAPNASYASQGSIYGQASKPSLIGHVSTNPINKTDPGPQVMAEINQWT